MSRAFCHYAVKRQKCADGKHLILFMFPVTLTLITQVLERPLLQEFLLPRGILLRFLHNRTFIVPSLLRSMDVPDSVFLYLQEILTLWLQITQLQRKGGDMTIILPAENPGFVRTARLSFTATVSVRHMEMYL